VTALIIKIVMEIMATKKLSAFERKIIGNHTIFSIYIRLFIKGFILKSIYENSPGITKPPVTFLLSITEVANFFIMTLPVRQTMKH
jgi:hypothetical protein